MFKLNHSLAFGGLHVLSDAQDHMPHATRLRVKHSVIEQVVALQRMSLDTVRRLTE